MGIALRNAIIINGTDRARYRGDVGISGNKVAAMGRVEGRARAFSSQMHTSDDSENAAKQ